MICSVCKKEKPESEFYKNKAKRGGRSDYCKICNAKRNRSYYRANREAQYKRVKDRNRRIVEASTRYIEQYLVEHPCVDCGEDDPMVLDFDHVRGVRRECISQMKFNAFSLETIKQEIELCEIRCANCHRRITHLRRLKLKFQAL